MDYGSIISRAWRNLWKYKALWLFGLLAAIGSGGGGGGGGGSSRYTIGGADGKNPFPQLEPYFNRITNWVEGIPAWTVVVLVLAGIVLVLLVLVVHSLGKAGLMKGAWLADSGAEKLGVGQLFGEAFKYFWKVLGMLLLFSLGILLIVILTVTPMIILGTLTLGIGLLCMLPLLCVLAFAAWLVNILLEQAIVGIVGEDLGMFAALTRAWEMMRANLGSYVVMGLIIAVGEFIVRFIISLPAFLILAPIFFGVLQGSANVFKTTAVISLVGLCLYVPVVWFLQALVTAFVSCLWTNTYRDLRPHPSAPAAEVVEATPAQPA